MSESLHSITQQIGIEAGAMGVWLGAPAIVGGLWCAACARCRDGRQMDRRERKDDRNDVPSQVQASLLDRLTGVYLSIEALGFTEVAPLHLLLLILKDGHSSLHAPKTELAVERLFARDRIQDDFLVPT